MPRSHRHILSALVLLGVLLALLFATACRPLDATTRRVPAPVPARAGHLCIPYDPSPARLSPDDDSGDMGFLADEDGQELCQPPRSPIGGR